LTHTEAQACAFAFSPFRVRGRSHQGIVGPGDGYARGLLHAHASDVTHALQPAVKPRITG
jgi:hypothetical protein